MKKFFFCLVASLFVAFAACEKTPEGTPEGNDSIPGGIENPDGPAITASILGHWQLDQAIQNANGNDVDITNFYGIEFPLYFEEDGTLITSDGINQNPMQWTMDGDQLGFIQVPGSPAVMYTIKRLSDTQLIIENGTGTDYVTVMTLHRVND